MKEFFSHLLLPRHTNNHRARLLHHDIQLLILSLLLIAVLFIPGLKHTFPQVLGSTINISAQRLLDLTNQKRKELGLESLRFNDGLNKAAQMKASDMFAKNYWSHNAPDGTTPWYFIKKSGYSYYFAGENLARGFSTSDEVVTAWMASPKHKENMLSSNYQEIGFAIMEGKLLGEDTYLVVEMLGSQTVPVYAKGTQLKPQTEIVTSPQKIVESLKTAPLIDIHWLFSSLAFWLIVGFIGLFVIDVILIEKRKIVRALGHAVDHVIFFSMLLLFITIFVKGLIL